MMLVAHEAWATMRHAVRWGSSPKRRVQRAETVPVIDHRRIELKLEGNYIGPVGDERPCRSEGLSAVGSYSC